MTWIKQTPIGSSWDKESSYNIWAYLLCEDGSKLLQQNTKGILLEDSASYDISLTSSWTKDTSLPKSWNKTTSRSLSWSKV